EIARAKVTNEVVRPDVQHVYPNLHDANESGFSVTFMDLPAYNQGHTYQYVLRFSNQENGEGKYTDTWSGYFHGNGQKYNGLMNENGQVYFYRDGYRQTGQQYYNNHYYYFDEVTNAMVTGLKYISNQNKTVYYASNGQLQYGEIHVGNITYYADYGSGAINGVFNNAEVIGQNPELPTGCEITAVTMMLKYAGQNVNKVQLANEMPRSNNGDYGFVGNPFSVTGWWVFPTGVAPVVNNHLGTSQVMTGASMASIQDKLLHGHLVVVWMGNMNGFINHAVTLTGYRNDILYYNNPWTAQKESMTVSQFYSHWNADKQRALSY
ncbi:C39 family peptidase, partial [Ligilactobacillus equi]